MQDIKQFVGKLNLDDSEEVIAPGDHAMSYDIVFRGSGNNVRVENIKGNRELPNTDLPTGSNICIGAFYDEFNQRIYYFLYNSTGKHSIFQYDIKADLFSDLVIVGTGTNGDVLGFTAAHVIPNINIIYGDSTQGDIIYWLNSQGKPCKINVQRALGTLGTYGTIQTSYLEVIKAPPQIPPAVTFEDDSSVTVNNFRKKLMKYKYRFVFDDKDKSVWSSHSVVPLPIGYTDSAADLNADPEKNARVALVLQTGKPNVKKIEIAACEGLGNVFSDFFLIHVIDKSVDSVADNSLTSYRFFNDQAYNYIDVPESIQPFDLVPQAANAQELLNGNVIIYGGITENYNPIIPTTVATAASNTALKTTQFPFVFVASQSGNSGFGTGDILTKIIGTIPEGWIFHILTTNEDIEYQAEPGDTAADVIIGLAAAAVTAGFTETHTTENLTITQTGEALQLLLVDYGDGTVHPSISVGWDLSSTTFTLVGQASLVAEFPVGGAMLISNASDPAFNGLYVIITSSVVAGSNLELVFTTAVTLPDDAFIASITSYPSGATGLAVTDSFAYDWWSNYGFCQTYFDEEGRTCGAVTNRGQSVQTIGYDDNGTTDVVLPQINLSISHRPPLEAKYFTIGRTKNLTKSDFIQWISNATYKDAEFAYVSIEVLNQYIVVNPQSNFLAWEFTPGDRIRFMRILSGSSFDIYTDKDYEIQASLTDTYVNGVLIEGQLFKFPLPTTDGDFDFGGTDWANYLIEIYTPAKSVADGLDVYYEFGERYMIGDAGLSTRYHQGMTQNQTPNLSQPALYEFIQGDNYFAERTLNVGNQIKYTVANNSNTDPNEWFLGMTKISGFDVQDYVVADQAFVATAGTIPAIEYFIKVQNGSYTFQVTGQIRVRIDDYVADPGITGTVRFLYSPFIVGVPGTNLGEQFGPFVSGQVLTFPIDFTVTRAAADDGTMSIVISNRRIGPGGAFNLDYTILDGYLTVNQTGNTYTVGLQNPNFSFNYESAVNSNGRPWTVDPDAKQNYNSVLARYGLAYQQDTNINQVNRFFYNNFDEYDRAKGDIRRFKSRERFMRVFQAAGTGQVGVYSQFITNSKGETSLIYTDQIITQNNIQYYLGEYGMGDGNTALCSNKHADYFDDPVRGYELRVSNDGITPISKLYKGQFYISRLITPYNKTWTRADGTIAKILKAYDYFEEQSVTILQSGTNGGDTIDSYAFDFNEPRNSYNTFLNYKLAEWIICAEDVIYSWKNGKLYKHDSATRSNFYGVQYFPSITAVFNSQIAIKKSFLALAYQSNQFWVSPENGDISTSMINPQTGLRQISSLKAVDFEIQENIRYAALLKDANSLSDARYALLNGDTLKGNWVKCKLEYRGSSFSWIFIPYCHFAISPRNL